MKVKLFLSSRSNFVPLIDSNQNAKLSVVYDDKKLGPYDQARIDAIRSFKDDVIEELSKATRSRFWLRPHGPYADMQDWDLSRLLHYFEQKHPDVPKEAIGKFMPYAIYLY